MENASLIGLSRQVALRREMDVIANNMANVNTPAFKAEAMMFAEYLSPTAAADMDRPRDRSVSFVEDVATVRDFSTGGLTPTGAPLDVALQGDGWMVIQTPDGDRYTRNGGFQLDPQGRLVTNEGHPVMGEAGGPITFNRNDLDIAIGADGTISSSEGDKGKLRIVQFETNMDLKPVGSSMYETDADALAAENPRVVQGFVERSNVQPVLEISRMIEVNRAYQSLANTLNKQDQLRRQAIEALGSLQA
jgi:flagellar basal-body rod protein FlgF